MGPGAGAPGPHRVAAVSASRWVAACKAAMKAGAEDGVMPAKVWLKVRALVTAGLAKSSATVPSPTECVEPQRPRRLRLDGALAVGRLAEQLCSLASKGQQDWWPSYERMRARVSRRFPDP